MNPRLGTPPSTPRDTLPLSLRHVRACVCVRVRARACVCVRACVTFYETQIQGLILKKKAPCFSVQNTRHPPSGVQSHPSGRPECHPANAPMGPENPPWLEPPLCTVSAMRMTEWARNVANNLCDRQHAQSFSTPFFAPHHFTTQSQAHTPAIEANKRERDIRNSRAFIVFKGSVRRLVTMNRLHAYHPPASSYPSLRLALSSQDTSPSCHP